MKYPGIHLALASPSRIAVKSGLMRRRLEHSYCCRITKGIECAINQPIIMRCYLDSSVLEVEEILQRSETKD